MGKFIGILNRLKRYLSTDILRTLYSAPILPHFQFSVLTWGFKANRTVKFQKRAIRVITNSKYNAHVEPLLKRLNLLKVSDIFHNSLLKLFLNTNLWIFPTISCLCSQTRVTHTITITDTTQFQIIQYQVCLEVRNASGTIYRVLLKKPTRMFSKRWIRIVIMGSVYTYGEFVYKITNRNAARELVIRVKIENSDSWKTFYHYIW